MKAEPAEVRFWRYTDTGGDCWEWRAARDASGYGRLQVGRVSALAHRVSWEIANGSLPAGVHVLHRCDNRGCVNPAHLFLGTNAANVADRVAKRRSGGPRGERNTKAKLTAAQIADIRARYVPAPAGHPPRGVRRSAALLAAEFGVSRSTIYHIARRWTWTDPE